MTRKLIALPSPQDIEGFRPGAGKSAQARALYVAGASTYEIAVYLRLSHAHVRRAIRELPPAKAGPYRKLVDIANEDQFFAKWARTHLSDQPKRPSDKTFRRVYA